MSSKIQPFVYNNTGDEEKKVLELKDEPKFSKIEDPFFDDEDIELFDEENLVTLELKDEMKKKNYTHYNTKIFWMEKKTIHMSIMP